MILPAECDKSAENFLFVLQSNLCTTARSPLGNGKVTVIYKVTAIYICRKYKAIENFGRLSGDRCIQGRYIQI